ncbi:MAG: MbnP family protein [Bacteroidota bacterium]
MFDKERFSVKFLSLVLSGLLFLTLQTGCENNPDDDLGPIVDVEINFKAQFDDELLLMRKNYQLDDSTEIRFTRVSFYVSDVVLLKNINGEEEETDVFDLQLVDFTDFTEVNPGNVADGISFVGTNVPVDRYDGIKMGLGVPADLNRTSPAKYDSGHPLASSLHYWQGWQSYMFAMIEGAIDFNGDGNFDSDENFLYHLGSDDAYESTFIYDTLTLEEGKNPTFEVKVDLRRLFRKTDGTPVFDASDKKTTHNPDDFAFISQLMLYFSQVFSL